MLFLCLFTIGTFILSLFYAAFLAYLAHSWQVAKRKYQDLPSVLKFPKVAVIVPARNEAEGIAACINAILCQDYPTDKLEVIIVDDHSTDTTASVVSDISDQRLQLLQLAGREKGGKKAALEKGIKQAQSEWIVTTDADITAPADWLKEIVSAQATGVKMILGPVKMSGPDNLLTAWQGLDVAGTMLLTGAAVYRGRPILANGANLAFSKAFFTELGAYEGNENRASGDDIFLLQKAVQQDPGVITYLFSSSAAVTTMAEASWTHLFWQRLRWAAKTGAYRDPYLIVFQALVYLLCLSLVMGALLLFWWPAFAPWVLAGWLVKLLAETFYLRYACNETGEKHWLRWLLPVQLLHPLYILFIGTLALLPISFYWKGRKVN